MNDARVWLVSLLYLAACLVAIFVFPSITGWLLLGAALVVAYIYIYKLSGRKIDPVEGVIVALLNWAGSWAISQLPKTSENALTWIVVLLAVLTILVAYAYNWMANRSRNLSQLGR